VAGKETDVWAGKALAARRAKKSLTQGELGAKAGLARETVVKLETGERRISPYYAEKLAPHVGLKDHRKLLPPQDQPAEDDEDPLTRLAAAEAEIAFLQEWVAKAFEMLGVAPEIQEAARRAVYANGG
jgi:transcriptional regulator with XRE-family HTH domain